MKWIEVVINAQSELMQPLCDFLESMGIDGFVLEDERDFVDFMENNRQYWDYVDDELLEAKRGVSRVKFYLSDDEDGKNTLAKIRKRLVENTQFSKLFLDTCSVADEDWEENWKQYYKSTEVGKRLIVVPEWENLPDGCARVPLRLDPGLMFGTGNHPTTRMCLENIEKYVGSGCNVLDLGCGSGILAIASILLGAKCAIGCDIDEKAPRIVAENAAMNGIDETNLAVYVGDITRDKKLSAKLSGKYDLVLANIVADVIINLSEHVCEYLADDGIFICSGIIDGREEEVESAIKAGGLTPTGHFQCEDWHCFTAIRTI